MNSARPLLGIDLGGTKVRVGKVVAGSVTRRATGRIDGKADEEVVLARIYDTIDRVIDDEVVGIGCGVPSVVDVEQGIVYRVENIPSWRRVRLKDKLEERYRRPATINNDANAFVLGELHFGKAKGYRNVVGLTLGTGLGAGIICNGCLYTGANCGAGEIGSIPYREHTLEHYAAGSFFRHRAGVAGDVVFERVKAGDEEALHLFLEYGRELGDAILIVLYTYDPELIVLGGSISEAYPFFERGMRDRLRDFEYQHALARLVIACSELADAAVLGAAALCLGAGPR